MNSITAPNGHRYLYYGTLQTAKNHIERTYSGDYLEMVIIIRSGIMYKFIDGRWKKIKH